MNQGASKALKAQFYSFPGTKAAFSEQCNRFEVLKSLWHGSKQFKVENDTLNSPSTLAAEIKLKDKVFEQVARENPNSDGNKLKFKQWFRYGKNFISFYKTGVTNVWQNSKEYRLLVNRDFKLVNQVSNKGRDVEIKIPNFEKLTFEMAQALYSSKIENKSLEDNTAGTMVDTSKEVRTVDRNLFNLTRHQYLVIKRTPKDFVKLPLFAVVFGICMECTPLICYLFPEITPLTCVLPFHVPKIANAGASKQLLASRSAHQDAKLEDLALKNAYNLPIKEARLLAKALRLTTKYIPPQLYPESVIRKRLHLHYNFLCVDNYYLSGLSGENSGNVWNLSSQELISACLDRNLILDIKKDYQEMNSIKDELAKLNALNEYFNNLRIHLFLFIVNFDQCNLGYLGLHPFIYKDLNTQKIMNWWEEDNSS